MGRSLGRFKISVVLITICISPLKISCVQKVLDLGQEVVIIIINRKSGLYFLVIGAQKPKKQNKPRNSLDLNTPPRVLRCILHIHRREMRAKLQVLFLVLRAVWDVSLHNAAVQPL